MTLLILREIDAIQEPRHGDYYPHLPRCEWCYEDCSADLIESREMRQFYELQDGLVVCEHCIDKVTE